MKQLSDADFALLCDLAEWAMQDCKAPTNYLYNKKRRGAMLLRKLKRRFNKHQFLILRTDER